MELPKYPKYPLHLLTGDDFPPFISPLKINTYAPINPIKARQIT